MPKTPNVTQITAGQSVQITFTRPICDYTARRISRVALQMRALNAAGKTQQDAACAVGISVPTLRNYCEMIGLEWQNVRKYTVNRIAGR